MADIFSSEFEIVARRALSSWNRDPGSPSFGSFDRAYWGWKAKDFSDATLQYAVRLAVRYVTTRATGVVDPDWLNAWLEGYVDFCRATQHRDGSFDQCYPHERTPGVVYDMLSALLYVRDSGCLRSPRALADLDGVIDRAVTFAMSEDERHGEVANHLGSYAYELLHYGRARQHAGATARAQAYLERMLKTFERDEGWFLEYQGPDAGYQTRTLRYLTKCAEILDDAELWKVAGRAAEFLEHLLMPDGSVHPMLGTRSTALVYPSGFMRLARRWPRFQPMASLVRSGWQHARVPLPSTLDFDNAIRLADDAFEAGALGGMPEVETPPAAAGRTELPRAGLTIWREPNRAVFVASRLGGVVVIYERSADGWRLKHEDSGYLIRSTGAKVVRWITRFPGSGTLATSTADRLVIRCRFARSLHEELTPFRMVALRVLNMTMLRVQWIADVFRRIVVRRLMDRSDWLGVEIERDIAVTAAQVVIRDRVTAGRLPDGAALFRCRRVSGTHMATARYFQEQEIEPGAPWQEPIEWPTDGHLSETVIAVVSTMKVAR